MKLPRKYKCNLCGLEFNSGDVWGINSANQNAQIEAVPPEESDRHLCRRCANCLVNTFKAKFAATDGARPG